MSCQTRLARQMERLVAGRPPSITFILEGPHNSWSASKYFDLLADRRNAAVGFLTVRGYDLSNEVASPGLYPDLTLQFRLRGYSDDFGRSEALPPPSWNDHHEEATMLPAGKENYPEFWADGLKFAQKRYESIVGTHEEPRTIDELKTLVADEVETLQEVTYARSDEAVRRSSEGRTTDRVQARGHQHDVGCLHERSDRSLQIVNPIGTGSLRKEIVMGLFGSRMYEAMGFLELIDDNGEFTCTGVNASGKVGSKVKVYQQLSGMRVDPSRFVLGVILSVNVGGYGTDYRVRVTEGDMRAG